MPNSGDSLPGFGLHVSCVRATGAADLKELARICNEFLPDSYPKRVQDWERYASGKHAPSLDRSGAPGIVRILGSHFPATLRVAEHSIWDVLDPGIEISTAVADRILVRLHPVVTDPLVSVSSQFDVPMIEFGDDGFGHHEGDRQGRDGATRTRSGATMALKIKIKIMNTNTNTNTNAARVEAGGVRG